MATYWGEGSHLLGRRLFFFSSFFAFGLLRPAGFPKHMPPAVEARSLNHWTAREVPLSLIFKKESSDLIKTI